MALGSQKNPSQDRGDYILSNSQTTGPNTPPSPLAKIHRSLAIHSATLSYSTINSISGAFAGAASGVVTCPLDVIKTKLQAQGGFRRAASTNKAQYRGLINTAHVIWRQDGLRGMYRGLGPMLLGYLPTWAVYMSIYGSSREYYYGFVDNKPLAQVYASITAGACSTVVTNPIWVIKTRLMSQVGDTAAKETRTPWHYRSTLDAFRKMYQAEGIGAFYSGLAPALLGLTHVAIQFPLYEYFKLQFTGLEMGQTSTDVHDHHWIGILAATFFSKICATSATYPHEVLRTRLQTQQRARASPASSGEGVSNTVAKYRGVVVTFRTILREEGWRAFYYGMGTNMLRAVPAAMTTMLTFESVKGWLQDLRDEGLRIRHDQEEA